MAKARISLNLDLEDKKQKFIYDLLVNEFNPVPKVVGWFDSYQIQMGNRTTAHERVLAKLLEVAIIGKVQTIPQNLRITKEISEVVNTNSNVNQMKIKSFEDNQDFGFVEKEKNDYNKILDNLTDDHILNK
jgi:hypothetical protein